MSQFLLDNMTGAAGLYAGTHTADVGGAPTAFIGTDQGQLNGGGRLYAAQSWYKFSSATPASANYSVSADLYNYQDIDESAGVIGRIQSDDKHYRFYSDQGTWHLEYYDGSSYTSLATYAQAPTDDTHYIAKLEMIGTAIKGYVDGVLRCSATDGNITLAGLPGCYINAGSGYNSIDQLYADDASSTTPLTLTTTQASSTLLSRGAGVTRSATKASSALLSRAAGVARGVTQASSTAASRAVGATRSATQASSPTLARAVGAIRSATQASSAAMSRAVGVVRIATQASVASIAVPFGRGLMLLATQASTAAISRAVGAKRSATQASSAALQRAIAFRRAVTQASSAAWSMAGMLTLSLFATAGSLAVMARAFATTRSAAASSSASIQRGVALTRVATQASTASLRRGVGKALKAVQSFVAWLGAATFRPPHAPAEHVNVRMDIFDALQFFYIVAAAPRFDLEPTIQRFDIRDPR